MRCSRCLDATEDRDTREYASTRCVVPDMIAAVSARIPDEDRALVMSALSGSQPARETLGRRVGRSAYLFAFQLTGDRETAHDVAQDGVLRFFQHLDRFDTDRPIEPWLYQIVRNRVRDLSRRDRIRRHESLDAWIDDGRVGAPPAPDDPAGEAERNELRLRIWRAVAELSPEHREIFVLRDFHDLSYAEIAHILGIPQGTVMSRLHAARRRLRTSLADAVEIELGHETRGAGDG